MLQNPNRPINNRSYFENFENVMEQSRALGSNMSQLTFDANRGDLDQFGERVEATCQSICQLMEGAAQIAYLVGASDERSKPGKKALVDREHLEALRDEYLGAWKKVAYSNFLIANVVSFCFYMRSKSCWNRDSFLILDSFPMKESLLVLFIFAD